MHHALELGARLSPAFFLSLAPWRTPAAAASSARAARPPDLRATERSRRVRLSPVVESANAARAWRACNEYARDARVYRFARATGVLLGSPRRCPRCYTDTSFAASEKGRLPPPPSRRITHAHVHGGNRRPHKYINMARCACRGHRKRCLYVRRYLV